MQMVFRREGLLRFCFAQFFLKQLPVKGKTLFTLVFADDAKFIKFWLRNRVNSKQVKRTFWMHGNQSKSFQHGQIP